MKRSENGYRCGESHPRAKASDAIVAAARDWAEFDGLTPTEVAARLGREYGLHVTPGVVQQWLYYTRRNTTPREREERVPTHRTLR